MKNNKRLLFFTSVDWYFWSHRLQLALEAKNKGYQVAVITKITESAKKIEDLGITVYALPGFKRNTTSVIANIIIFLRLCIVLIKFKPTLLHNIALKPVLLGTIATSLYKNVRTVNTIAGFGIVKVSQKMSHKLIFFFLKKAFSILSNLPSVSFIVQNQNDLDLLSNEYFTDLNRIHLIQGSGITIPKLLINKKKSGTPVFLFASRLIEAKGITTYINAAEELLKEGVKAKFLIAGSIDNEAVSSISKNSLNNNAVEWLGHRMDIALLINQSRAVCLFSTYGEGVPRILLESLALSTPIITTNTPGCGELVDGGRNGILLPSIDIKDVKDAINFLINSPDEAIRMGKNGRHFLKNGYDIDSVNRKIFEIYES